MRRSDIKLWPNGYNFPYACVASYNELEYLHMQVLLNCHLATFYNLNGLYKW